MYPSPFLPLGVRDLIPTRTFRGRIGPDGNWEETAPAQDVSTLPSDVPANTHTDTVDLNLSPMKLYSKKATDTAGWKDEHTFVSDMSGGPMVVMDPSAVTSIEFDDVTGEIEKITYRIQVGLQTPAPEYLASDLNDGYEYDQQFRYVVYANTALAAGAIEQDTVDVPQFWRRGATYVEVEYKRDWFSEDPNDDDSAGAASFFVYRESKKSGGDWNENDPFTDPGVHAGASAAFSSICFATNE